MNKRAAFAFTIALVLLVPSTVPAQSAFPDYYVGLGVRAGLRDSTALVIDSKITLARVETWTISLRPTLLWAGGPELRVAVSLDLLVTDRFVLYGGAGIAWNESQAARVDPMLAVGIDCVLAGSFVLDLNLNHLIKPHDTDTEFTASLNYAFTSPFR